MKKFALILVALSILVVAGCGGGGGGGGGTVLPPGGTHTISGILTDTSGAPLAGLEVTIDGQGTGVMTDSTGHFSLSASRFPGGVAGHHKIGVRKDGVAIAEQGRDFASGESDFRMGFKPPEPGGGSGGTGTMEGRVFNADTEAPIEGADVLLISPFGDFLQTQSAADGTYSFTDAPAGDDFAIVIKDGFRTKFSDVTIPEGGTLNKDFGLVPLGGTTVTGIKVYGTVTDKEAGTPIEGATVEIYIEPFMPPYMGGGGGGTTNSGGGGMMGGPGTGSRPEPSPPPYDEKDYYRQTTTDANGYYEFLDVSGVNLTIFIHKDGYRPYRDYFSLVDRTELKNDVQLVKVYYGSLSGNVTKDSGGPVEGAEVVASLWGGGGVMPMNPPGPPTAGGGTGSDSGTGTSEPGQGMPYPGDIDGYYQTSTDASGNYSFDKLPEGDYYISVYKNGFEPGYDTVTIVRDTAATKNFVLNHIPSGTIKGKVTDNKGNPLAGASVGLDYYYMMGDGTRPPMPPQNGGYGSSSDPTKPGAYFYPWPGGWWTVTDENGNYELTYVPVGDQPVVAWMEGYLDDHKTVTVTDGQTSTQDFSLTPLSEVPRAVLSGIVTDAVTGAPIPGVYIYLSGPGMLTVIPAETYTDENGFYSMEVIPGGYWLGAYKDGYEPFGHELTVPADGLKFDFEMFPGGNDPPPEPGGGGSTGGGGVPK